MLIVKVLRDRLVEDPLHRRGLDEQRHALRADASQHTKEGHRIGDMLDDMAGDDEVRRGLQLRARLFSEKFPLDARALRNGAVWPVRRIETGKIARPSFQYARQP